MKLFQYGILFSLFLVSGCGPIFGSGTLVDVTKRERGGYQIDRYVAPRSADAAIHMIGIYEGTSDHDHNHHNTGRVTITIEDQGDQAIMLALASYEPVIWQLVGPGVKSVMGVYVDGYNRHSVTGVTEGLIINRSAQRSQPRASEDWDEEDMEELAYRRRQEKLGTLSYAPISCTMTYWDHDGGGCGSAMQFQTNAENLLHSKMASFTGVYNAQAFTIHAMPKAPDRPKPTSNPWGDAQP